MWIEQLPNDNSFFEAVQDAAQSQGIPKVADLNGALMEQAAGTSVRDANIHDGRRQSPYRSFVTPVQNQKNLTVLTAAEVGRSCSKRPGRRGQADRRCRALCRPAGRSLAGGGQHPRRPDALRGRRP